MDDVVEGRGIYLPKTWRKPEASLFSIPIERFRNRAILLIPAGLGRQAPGRPGRTCPACCSSIRFDQATGKHRSSTNFDAIRDEYRRHG